MSCAEQLAVNAERDGVEVRLSVYPEKVHGWLILSKLPASLEAAAEIDAWIDDRLGLHTRREVSDGEDAL